MMGQRLLSIVPICLATLLASGEAGGPERVYRVEVVAGTEGISDGGPATDAALAGVSGLAVDGEFNVYFADTSHNRIRKVDAASGTISTIAGTGAIAGDLKEGPATGVAIFAPGPLALDEHGKRLFVAEVPGHRVLEIDLETGDLRDLGSPRLGFGQPVGLLWTGERLLVADTLVGQVWTLEEEKWKGLLPRSAGLSGGIRSMAVDSQGNLYVSDFFGHRVVRWVADGGPLAGVVGTGVAGRSKDGMPAHEAQVGTPDGLAMDRDGNLYFADLGNSRVAMVEAETGLLRTYVSSPKGPDGWSPGAIALDREQRLWIADVRRNRILRFVSPGASPEVIAGGGDVGDGGLATDAHLAHPGRVALDGQGNLYVSDAMNHRVRRIELTSGRIDSVAGTGVPGYNGDSFGGALAQLNYPGGLIVDPSGHLFIADYYNNRVRRLDLANGVISTVVGNGSAGAPNAGPATETPLLNPHALSLHPDGKLLITSAVEASVLEIDIDAGTARHVELDPEAVPPYRVLVFYGIAASDGGFYLADGMRDTVWFYRDGNMTQVVGAPHLNYPMDVAVSPDGELYISDTRNDRVVKWNGSSIEVVASGLARPRGVAFGADGALYVADTFHNRVLRITEGDERRW